jgi:hypothetical protein
MMVMTRLCMTDPQRLLLLAAFGVGGRISEGHRQKRR